MSSDTYEADVEHLQLQFLQEVMVLIHEYISDRCNPTLSILPPLYTALEVRQWLYGRPPDGAREGGRHSTTQVLDTCRQVVSAAVRTAHPNFVSQIYSKADVYGIAAEIIVAALNNNAHVFQLSQVMSVIEKDIIGYLSGIFGFGSKDGSREADGAFVPGASAGNTHALFVALHKADPSVREDGIAITGKRYVAFCSESAHFSMDKAAMTLGIGSKGMRKIPSDQKGIMRTDLLEIALCEAIKQGETPFCICATAGTTVLCAFDPLLTIAEIAERYGIWLHVDAAWGGAAAFSPRYANLLEGLGRADSLVFSAHKMLGAPLQCAAFLVNGRHSGIVMEAMTVEAPCIYQNSINVQSEAPDLSKLTLQCGRRADAFKFWLMREALGAVGLARKVEDCVSWADKFRLEIVRREINRTGFRLFAQSFSTVSFWFIPITLNIIDVELLTPDDEVWKIVDHIPDQVRNTLIQRGMPLLVSHGSVPGLPRFFRLGISSSPVELSQALKSIENILDTIESLAEAAVTGKS